MRTYTNICDALMRAELPSDREGRMHAFVNASWQHLHDHGVSWIGFYIDHPNNPEDQRLILGPCRNSPACSPIGLHGACGQALVSGETLIVRDVADLGDGYIACDPRDRSEIVLPLFDPTGTCWGVLDVDSHDVGSFDVSDERGFKSALHAAGLL